MESLDIRWRQRYGNFSRAYSLLRSALEEKDINGFDDLQREGLVQRFEYTFELMWKTVKDFLQNEKVDIEIVSPKNVIKAAASCGMLEASGADGEILLDMLDTRNMLSHTYDEEQFRSALMKLKQTYLPQIDIIFDYLTGKVLTDD